MHIVAGRLVTTSLVVFPQALPRCRASSNVEAAWAGIVVTVYPDGASITRAIMAGISRR